MRGSAFSRAERVWERRGGGDNVARKGVQSEHLHAVPLFPVPVSRLSVFPRSFFFFITSRESHRRRFTDLAVGRLYQIRGWGISNDFAASRLGILFTYEESTPVAEGVVIEVGPCTVSDLLGEFLLCHIWLRGATGGRRGSSGAVRGKKTKSERPVQRTRDLPLPCKSIYSVTYRLGAPVRFLLFPRGQFLLLV